MTEPLDTQLLAIRQRLSDGVSVEPDELLALALTLREHGDPVDALDLLVARWFVIPDDPSAPWNLVAPLADLRQPILAAVCRFLTYRSLQREDTTGAVCKDDDDWAGNAVAFAFGDLLEAGALTSAAALLRYIADPDERDEYAARLHNLES
ncbi:MAG: hypothetical protein ACYDHH_23965 [Solirubrobacteraceae bacterium]